MSRHAPCVKKWENIKYNFGSSRGWGCLNFCLHGIRCKRDLERGGGMGVSPVKARWQPWWGIVMLLIEQTLVSESSQKLMPVRQPLSRPALSHSRHTRYQLRRVRCYPSAQDPSARYLLQFNAKLSPKRSGRTSARTLWPSPRNDLLLLQQSCFGIVRLCVGLSSSLLHIVHTHARAHTHGERERNYELVKCMYDTFIQLFAAHKAMLLSKKLTSIVQLTISPICEEVGTTEPDSISTSLRTALPCALCP